MNSEEKATNQGQSSKKRVLIVDDHPIFRLGLAGLISEQHHLEVCGHAESAPLALEAMRRFKPDLGASPLGKGTPELDFKHRLPL